jgi:hypothetical protein
MSLPESFIRPPTHEETAADVADAAAVESPSPAPAARLVARMFWWLAHHAVARPLALVFPVRHMFRFSAWTLGRRNM